MNAEFVKGDSQDTFYFESVSSDTINRVVSYVSMITPLMRIFNSHKFDIDMFYEGEVALKQLTDMMKRSYDGTRRLEKGVYSK